MPLYEYECNKGSCGLTFESLSIRGDTSNTAECPSCKSSSTKREVPTSFGFSFSGGTQNEVIDMSVGRASEAGWMRQQDRQAEKAKIRQKEGLLTVSKIDNKYVPLSKEGGVEASSLLNGYNSLPKEQKHEISDFKIKQKVEAK